jgi:glycosyltransferase involved in cell wall biosynthesis
MKTNLLRVGCISRPSVNPVFSRFPQRRHYLVERLPQDLVECVPITITPSSSPSLHLAYLQGMLRAFRQARRLPLDALLVEDMESALLGLGLKTACGCPLIFDFIDDYAEITRHDGRKMRFLAALGLERILPRAADLVIVTDDTKRRYCLELGVAAEKIAVIPNGFEPSMFAPAPRDAALARKLGVEGRRVVTFIGKLTPYYGLETIVRALPCVVSRQPDVVFLCVGDGSVAHGLRQLAVRTGMESHVLLPGPVACEEVPGLINLSDVCLLTVPTEAALVLYEYLACARPVIVPRGGTAKMTVSRETFPDDTVLRVERTPAGYAEGILRLLADSRDATNMGRNGRDLIVERNRWDTLALRYAEAIRKAATTGKRQGY